MNAGSDVSAVESDKDLVDPELDFDTFDLMNWGKEVGMIPRQAGRLNAGIIFAMVPQTSWLSAQHTLLNCIAPLIGGDFSRTGRIRGLMSAKSPAID